ASDRVALQTWTFESYHNYNVILRRKLKKLISDFIKKYRLTKVKQPTVQQVTFNLFVQENLLNKEVIDAVKDLNNITVDMKIFAADRRDVLQKLDIRTLLNLN
ncbi:6738_t:CDS:2, partial [Funneliformis mosseae]